MGVVRDIYRLLAPKLDPDEVEHIASTALAEVKEQRPHSRPEDFRLRRTRGLLTKSSDGTIKGISPRSVVYHSVTGCDDVTCVSGIDSQRRRY